MSSEILEPQWSGYWNRTRGLWSLKQGREVVHRAPCAVLELIHFVGDRAKAVHLTYAAHPEQPEDKLPDHAFPGHGAVQVRRSMGWRTGGGLLVVAARIAFLRPGGELWVLEPRSRPGDWRRTAHGASEWVPWRGA